MDSLEVRDHVLHTYKTTGNIVVSSTFWKSVTVVQVELNGVRSSLWDGSACHSFAMTLRIHCMCCQYAISVHYTFNDVKFLAGYAPLSTSLLYLVLCSSFWVFTSRGRKWVEGSCGSCTCPCKGWTCWNTLRAHLVVATTKRSSVEGNEVDIPKQWKLLHSQPFDWRPLVHNIGLETLASSVRCHKQENSERNKEC
jgi:hypothetical protein